MTLFVYEGWADLERFSDRFPPNKSIFARYQKYNQGAYHQWYKSFVKNLTTPARSVRLIPVASIIGRLLTSTKLNGLTPTDLYSDTGPHGTPTTYFMAAMITHAALYNESPPSNFRVPTTIHPLVRQHYATVIQTICDDPLINCGTP